MWAGGLGSACASLARVRGPVLTRGPARVAGIPYLQFRSAMEAEHCRRGGCDYEFTSLNHGLTTTPRREWELVVGSRSPSGAELGGGRRVPDIGALLELPRSKEARLAYEEVAALALYSGPMYVVYNAILRRFPEELHAAMRGAANLFATTLHALVSAVQKLARVAAAPDGLVLYRGLSGELPPHFFERDPQGCRGICEWGFMSTTSSLRVALRYSGVHEGKPLPTLLALRVGAVDRGACIREFSQYPAEMEYLWVPCSFLQPDASADDDGTSVRLLEGGAGGVSLVRVRVNGNLKAQTMDEIVESKKLAHLASFRHVLEEIEQELDDTAKRLDAEARLQLERQQRRAAVSVSRKRSGGDLKRQRTWACLGTFGKKVPPADAGASITVSSFLDNIVRQCTEVYDAHAQCDAASYALNPVFRGLVMEMLEVKDMAQSKLLFWLCDPTRLIEFIHDYPLRRAHRSRVAFLLRTLPSDPERRQDQAARLCQLKGLVVESVHETNEMGETRILWGAAEGITRRDLGLLLDARADPNARDDEGRTPIFVAASYGNLHCIKELAARGGSVLQARGDNVSPVWVAALNGFADCVAELGELRADVNQADGAGVTPAIIAAEKGHTACIRELHRLGADLDRADHAGRTPVWVAALNGFADCVAALGELGADVNAADCEGVTPAIIAAEKGHAGCIRELRRLGAKLESADNAGYTPLAIAAELQPEVGVGCVKALLEDLPGGSGSGR